MYVDILEKCYHYATVVRLLNFRGIRDHFDLWLLEMISGFDSVPKKESKSQIDGCCTGDVTV